MVESKKYNERRGKPKERDKREEKVKEFQQRSEKIDRAKVSDKSKIGWAEDIGELPDGSVEERLECRNFHIMTGMSVEKYAENQGLNISVGASLPLI